MSSPNSPKEAEGTRVRVSIERAKRQIELKLRDLV
jgi:hypothetical protein